MMANIIAEIVEYKLKEIEQDKKNFPLPYLFQLIRQGIPPTRGFFYNLKSSSTIKVIGELKFASPSRGIISKKDNLKRIIQTYTDNRIAAISVLTERKFFKGDSDYIRQVKRLTDLPVLRKDFILDEYQIYQSLCLGADALLLIASLLDEVSLMRFQKIANSLEMDCLVEVHNKEELGKALASGAKIIGINNRSLKDFSVNLSTTAQLAPLVPRDCVLVSESGIKDRKDIEELSHWGVDVVLIGETFMITDNLREKLKQLTGVKKRRREVRLYVN